MANRVERDRLHKVQPEGGRRRPTSTTIHPEHSAGPEAWGGFFREAGSFVRRASDWRKHLNRHRAEAGAWARCNVHGSLVTAAPVKNT